MKHLKHPLTHLPPEILKQSIVLCIFSAFSTLIFDRLAFSLQWTKDLIAANRIYLGIFTFALYFLSETLRLAADSFQSTLQLDHKQEQDKAILSSATALLLTVRGKVWYTVESNGKPITKLMSTNTMLSVTKLYLQNLWQFRTAIPTSIVELISAFLMLWSFAGVLDTSVEHSGILFLGILVTCAFSILTACIRTYTEKKAKKEGKDTSENYNAALNDALNIEPINSAHARYMAEQVTVNNAKDFKVKQKVNKNQKWSFVADSAFKALAMLFVITVKLHEVGVENVSEDFVTSVVALAAVYAQILSRFKSIIKILEKLVGFLNVINIYSDNFEAIIDAWDCEQTYASRYSHPAEISSMRIPAFHVSHRTQDDSIPFSLQNDQPLEFNIGDVVLFTGPTGSGKSTALGLASGTLRFEGVEIEYDFIQEGNVGSISFQADSKLGSNDVLSEITFGDKDFDKEKLLKILKGLHLYDEIFSKSKDVLGFLKKNYSDNFSFGQRVRLRIARILMNIDDSCQIIALDEITNGLNDEIKEQVLEFVCGFCKDKLLLFATHDVTIAKRFATRHVEFVPAEGGFYKISVVK